MIAYTTELKLEKRTYFITLKTNEKKRLHSEISNEVDDVEGSPIKKRIRASEYKLLNDTK
jgi:hypothetical protein